MDDGVFRKGNSSLVSEGGMRDRAHRWAKTEKYKSHVSTYFLGKKFSLRSGIQTDCCHGENHFSKKMLYSKTMYLS